MLKSEGHSQSRRAFRNVEVERDRLPQFEDRVATPASASSAACSGPLQHLGEGDGRGREAHVPCSMAFEERLETQEKERILFAGHRPGSRALRGNVGGLLAGEKLEKTLLEFVSPDPFPRGRGPLLQTNIPVLSVYEEFLTFHREKVGNPTDTAILATAWLGPRRKETLTRRGFAAPRVEARGGPRRHREPRRVGRSVRRRDMAMA